MSHRSVYKARILGMPEIASVDDLAFLLRISSQSIEHFSKRSWCGGYISSTLPKKSGGVRIIHAPVRELKYIQAWILRNILSRLHSSPCSTGFEPGNKIVDNASRHLGQSYVINVDIEDFFPSIGANKVYEIFSSIGYDKEIAWLLTNLLTFKGKLPQGSPASPKLANLICHRLDARIMGFCHKKNMSFSRYADDITISTSNRAHIEGTINFLKYVVGDEGFSLRPEKTAVYGRGSAKRITGLIVSDEIRVGRQKYREMRSMIHSALSTNDHEKLAYIDGYLNFLTDVDSVTYKMLFNYYSSVKTKLSKQLPSAVPN